nr:ribosomal protein L32 [Chlorella variabilis]ADZ05011.1 ribosomal protein L32 [Chlorella variabilis]
MAVPKKRTSKMKTRLRKAHWKAQASREALKALSKAKKVIKGLLVETSSNSDPSTESSN